MRDEYYKDTKAALVKFENEFDNVEPYLSNELQNLWSNLVNEVSLLLSEHDNNLEIINQLEEDKDQMRQRLGWADY